MGRKRQTFSKNFKARVVLEALREESTIQEIAGMEEIFERPNKKSQEVRQQEEKESEYLKTIGKRKVEIEFLKKSTGNCTERSHRSGSYRGHRQGIEHIKSVWFAGDS